MALLSTILATSLALTNTTLTNADINNNNIYQTYLPQQKINVEIFKGDNDSSYFLGVAFYARLIGAGTFNQISWYIPYWTFKLTANESTIYTLTQKEAGQLIVEDTPQEVFNNSGESIGFYREVRFENTNFNYYEINETILASFNAREITTDGIATINLSASLTIERAIIYGSDGEEWNPDQFIWGCSFGTLRTYGLNTYLNAGIYTFNPFFESYGLENYTQNVQLIDNPINNNSYTSNSSSNSTLRAYYGASYIENNLSYTMYNHSATKRLYYNDVDVNNTWFSSTYSVKDIDTFNISSNNFFYTRFYQTRRVPTNTRAFKNMILIDNTNTYTGEQYIFRINTVFNQKLLAGGSGSSGDETGEGLQIECSGTLLTNFNCYLSNAINSTLFQGPLFKPLMTLLNQIHDFVDGIGSMFFKILNLIRGDVL